MTDRERDEEWGPWIGHDGIGCPVPVGVYFAVEIMRRDLSKEIGEGVCTPLVANHGSWVAVDPFGGATMVTRYRVRKLLALTEMQEHIADIPAPNEREKVD